MNMNSVKYDFSGMVVIITGGARGIGAAICQSFARSGASVIIADIDEAGALERQRLIEADGGHALAVKVDVTRREEVERLMATALQTWGKIDVLVNNAGINTFYRFTEIPEREWDRVLAINAKGTFLCSQLASREMVKRNTGRIINISSQAGRSGQPFMAHYVASKFAVVGLTQTMALELGPFGVTVNAVCPGDVITDMRKETIKGLAPLQGVPPDDFDPLAIERCPLKRLELPEDVANAVLFLASEGAGFITGEAFNVSGGLEFH
jgi:meso-butanediol dehydrogenase / (S,S)-butanediol dehydrogenase / diacetyl reductase